MNVIGDRIKTRRVALGMSQMSLAVAIGSNPTQISRYERGENEPTVRVVVALANALKTSSDYLLGLTDDPAPRNEWADHSTV